MKPQYDYGKGRVPTLLRYHGGKSQLSKWVISHFPSHKAYIEPYGGAASVLLNKPPVSFELYNDISGEIVNLFRMVRDRGEELAEKIHDTPMAVEEYLDAFVSTDNPLENARRTIVRFWMAFHPCNAMGCVGYSRNYAFAGISDRGGCRVSAFRKLPGTVLRIMDRLRGVSIENAPALSVIKRNLRSGHLIYLDPPYTWGERSQGKYAHEISDDDHKELLSLIVEHGNTVAFVLSGYDSDMYKDHLQEWKRVCKTVRARSTAGGFSQRVETLWLSRAAQVNLQGTLDLPA